MAFSLDLWNVNWGSVPDWIAAVGTVGSLFAALWLLQGEIHERRRIQRDREFAPGRGVSAWCRSTGEDDWKWLLAVRNRGEEPIYNCMLYAYPLGPKYSAEEYPKAALEIMHPIVPPDFTSEDVFDQDYLEPDGPPYPLVEVEFTDAAGRHWLRDISGELKEIEHRRPFC